MTLGDRKEGTSWLSEWIRICPTLLGKGSGMICSKCSKEGLSWTLGGQDEVKKELQTRNYHWVMHTLKTEKLAPGAKLGGMSVDSCFQQWVRRSNVGWTARCVPSLQPWTWAAIVWMWLTRVREQACWLWHGCWLIEGAFIIRCWGGWDFRVYSSPFKCASLRALIFYHEGY